MMRRVISKGMHGSDIHNGLDSFMSSRSAVHVVTAALPAARDCHVHREQVNAVERDEVVFRSRGLACQSGSKHVASFDCRGGSGSAGPVGFSGLDLTLCIVEAV